MAGERHFQEPGVDELYKKEWVTMLMFCLLQAPRYNRRESNEQRMRLAQETADIYLQLQKQGASSTAHTP